MKCNFFKYLNLFFFIILFSDNSWGQEVTWLSGTPPPQISRKFRPSGMQRHVAFRAERGQEKLILWLRKGESPKDAEYIQKPLTKNPQIHVISPDGQELEVQTNEEATGYNITYNFKEEGYLNIYLIEKWVENETLFVNVNKAERLSHKCMNGHKGIKGRLKPEIYPEITDFEILRKRIPREDFHFFIESGNTIDYQVFYKGQELPDAKIKMITQEDWAKSEVTNEKGEAGFQFIADYFSNSKEIEKKKINNYLLVANYQVEESGNYDGKSYNSIVYQTTFAGKYIPSKSWYQSTIWAVLVVLISTIALILGIYLVRRRKQKYLKLSM